MPPTDDSGKMFNWSTSTLQKMQEKRLRLTHTRRDFLKVGSAALAFGSTLLRSRESYAKTLNLPLGLQLYSVRDLLPKDFAGTLKQIGSLGYQEVEAAGYFNHTTAEVKQGMSDAGLKLVSAHYSSDDLHSQLDQILAFNKEVGVSNIICSIPGYKDPSRLANLPPRDKGRDYTLDDWKWNAEQFNMLGEKVHAAGMNFGYHNHTMEFHEVDGVLPFAELLRLTDPAKVAMEMDCGWVIMGGGDPVELLNKYPTRISMLHVKDFKIAASPPATPSAANTPATAAPPAGQRRSRIAELGQGSIDYSPIFEAAAKTGHVKHCFVEQEGFDMPPMDSLKIDADYVKLLQKRS